METETFLLPDGPRQCFTSTVSLRSNDVIVIHVLNLNNDSKTARVLIYQTTGSGAQQVHDSSTMSVAPRWQCSVSYTVEDNKSGEYWVQIELRNLA